MKDNIIIHGLVADEHNETPTTTVEEFLQDKMELEFHTSQIITARRMGIPSPNPTTPRMMLVTLRSDLKDLIMSNLAKLKGKKNTNDKGYRIQKQLPESWTEENRQLRAAVQTAKKANDAKTDEQEKDHIQVRNCVLYMNKVAQKKQYLKAPPAVDMFPDQAEQDKLDKIKFSASATTDDNGSSFTAFALKVSSMTEVRRAYVKLKQLHPSASHIVASYAFKNFEGFQDDREYGAGYRILEKV